MWIHFDSIPIGVEFSRNPLFEVYRKVTDDSAFNTITQVVEHRLWLLYGDFKGYYYIPAAL